MVGTTGGVFNVNFIKRFIAIQSSDAELVRSIVGVLGIPRLDERRACWATNHSQRQNPMLRRQSCLHGFAKKHREPEAIPRRSHIPTRRRFPIVRIHRWMYRVQRNDDAMQREYHCCQDQDVLMSYHQTKWLASQYCWNQPRTETVTEEQASGCSDLLVRLAVEKRTIDVEESDRRVKRSKTDVSELAKELTHFGAAIGLRLRAGCQHLEWRTLVKSRWWNN